MGSLSRHQNHVLSLYLCITIIIIIIIIIIIMVYLLTALAAKQAEKVHLQVKIVSLKKDKYININM